MSGTVDALAQPLCTPERWSLPTPEGYVMTDPLTRRPINPNAPPSWIQGDPMLGPGLDYLRQRGSDLHFYIGYGSHSKAEDLGDIATGLFERAVKRADYYGSEGQQTTERNFRERLILGGAMLAHLRQTKKEPNVADFLELGAKAKAVMSSFEVRTLAAITLSGTESFVYDIAADGGPAEGALLLARKKFLATRSGDVPRLALANAGYINAREWSMAANMGNKIKQREAGVVRPVDTFVTVGAGHLDLMRKLDLCEVRVSHLFFDADAQRHGESVSLHGAFQRGVADKRQLHVAVRILAHLQQVNQAAGGYNT